MFSFETNFEKDYYGSKIQIFFTKTYDVVCVTFCRSLPNGCNGSKFKNFNNTQDAIDFYNQIIKECVNTEDFENISSKFN